MPVKTVVVPLRFPITFAQDLRRLADDRQTTVNALVRATLSASLRIPDEPLPRGLAGASDASRRRAYRASAKARGVKIGKRQKSAQKEK